MILVNGPPGSGKSTVARLLADQLSLPLLCKDDLKESMFDAAVDLFPGLSVSILDELDAFDDVVTRFMLELAKSLGSGVVEANFRIGQMSPLAVVPRSEMREVFCTCPMELLEQRYADRAPSRHQLHVRLPRPGELGSPVSGGNEVLGICESWRFETSHPLDRSAIIILAQKLGFDSFPSSH